jgi:hypothetical protein
MGLDNGFVLKSKKNKDIAIEIASFRKYYELDRYVMAHGEKTEDEYEVSVNAELLDKLSQKIEKIRDVLVRLPGNTVDKYDEEGYPEKYHAEFYGMDFSPCESQSAFAGHKLLRLYSRIECMKEILENDYEKDLYIIFYSSF